MEKFTHNKHGAGDAAGSFFVVTGFVSLLQKQLLDQKILLSNMPADLTDQAEQDRELQVLHLLEHLVEAEKKQQPHYAVSRLVAADAAVGSILGLEGRVEAEDNGNDQPGKSMVVACHISCVLDLDAIFADLFEERASKAAEVGNFAARWWYSKQVVKSALPILMQIGRNSVKRFSLSIFSGSGESIVKTTIVNVLAASITASLLGLIRHTIH